MRESDPSHAHIERTSDSYGREEEQGSRLASGITAFGIGITKTTHISKKNEKRQSEQRSGQCEEAHRSA